MTATEPTFKPFWGKSKHVVLITGAASGIGAATALEVMAQGGTPVLVDCDAEPLADMALRCGPNTLYCVADVTHLDAMHQVVAQTLSVHGQIDVVFANAGVAAFGPVAHVDPSAWRRREKFAPFFGSSSVHFINHVYVRRSDSHNTSNRASTWAVPFTSSP